MKTKIAAALSLTGVLVAGSAAALVNTQVLQRTDDSTGNLAAVGASVPTTVAAVATSTTIGAPTSTVPGDITSTTVAGSPVASVPVTSVPVASVPVTSAPGTVPGATSTQAVYRIGDAGTVTLDTAGDRLVVVTATPGAGWQVWKVEQQGPLAVEVKFRSATTEVEFRANLLFGVVGTSVETESIAPPPAGGGTPSTTPGGGSAPGTTIDDDDHDDDHDGGEHDDDEHDGGNDDGGEHDDDGGEHDDDD